MNIPTLLTLFRIVLIPVMVLVFYLPIPGSGLICAIIFAFAGITDWLDGYLARKLDQSTPFGAFLDPVADKLMVATALVLLTELHATPFMAVPAAVIIGREIMVSALREWMAEIGKRASIAVSYIGKVKTAVQIIAIVVLLGIDAFTKNYLYYLGFVLLDVAVVLTLWSMILYIQAAWSDLWPGATKSTDNGVDGD